MIPTPILGFLRRAVPTIALLVGASSLLLLTDRQSAKRSLPAIAVLQQTSSTVLEDAVKGMIAGLAERGWVDGKTVTIRRYNAEGDMAQANAIAREIAGGPFDLVLTSSTPSMQAVATANASGRLKHVFASAAPGRLR
jgi:putative ABC transport system substrate-binding protein